MSHLEVFNADRIAVAEGKTVADDAASMDSAIETRDPLTTDEQAAPVRRIEL